MSFQECLFGSGNTQLLLPNPAAAKSVVEVTSSRDCVQSIAVKPVQSIAQNAAAGASPVGQYLNAAIADNTRRAYQQDLRDFLKWGGAVPCTPETLAERIHELEHAHYPAAIEKVANGM